MVVSLTHSRFRCMTALRNHRVVPHRYANDLHCGGDQDVPGRWMHLVLRGDPETNKRAILIDGKQIGEDQPGQHDTKAAPLFIGGRFPISWAPDHDCLDGSISKVRIWKRALGDDELAVELNSAAPPDDLVRWFCFTEEDADTGNAVRNHASHGPENLVMKKEHGGDEPIATADAKPKWTTRADCSETDEKRATHERSEGRAAKP